MSRFRSLELWLRSLIAACISGAAGGILTGLAAVGIDPQHFNLSNGLPQTMRIGLAAAGINAIIGVAAFLQKSPLPPMENGNGNQANKVPSAT